MASSTAHHDARIAQMTFASVYPHYVTKVVKKGRTEAELRTVISWLTAGTVDVNHIFFDTFYTFLIMSDVCILLFTLLYTDDFPVIIRNSSFVVSTILLKLSFTAQPGMAQILLISGIAFGVIMLWFSRCL